MHIGFLYAIVTDPSCRARCRGPAGRGSSGSPARSAPARSSSWSTSSSSRSPTAGSRRSYDHSSGFGAWGPILVELTQVHQRAAGGAPAPALTARGHVGTRGRRPRRRVSGSGSSRSIPAVTGPASAVWLDGAPRSATTSRCSSAARRSTASTRRSAAAADGLGRQRLVSITASGNKIWTQIGHSVYSCPTGDRRPGGEP